MPLTLKAAQSYIYRLAIPLRACNLTLGLFGNGTLMTRIRHGFFIILNKKSVSHPCDRTFAHAIESAFFDVKKLGAEKD